MKRTIKLLKKNTRKSLTTQFYNYNINLPKDMITDIKWDVGATLSIEQVNIAGTDGLFLSKDD